MPHFRLGGSSPSWMSKRCWETTCFPWSKVSSGLHGMLTGGLATFVVCCQWFAGVWGLVPKWLKPGGCEPTFEQSDCFSVYYIYTFMEKYNHILGFLYGSFIKMIGKRNSPEKRSYVLFWDGGSTYNDFTWLDSWIHLFMSHMYDSKVLRQFSYKKYQESIM
jgi:hypothetical protein